MKDVQMFPETYQCYYVKNFTVLTLVGVTAT